MKKALAFLGAFAFVLILLVKPFNFMGTYSVHAGHAVHNAKANTDDGHSTHISESDVAKDRNVLVELSKASAESSSFRSGIWLTCLLVIGLISLGILAMKRESESND